MRSDTPPRTRLAPPMAAGRQDPDPERLALDGDEVGGGERPDADERRVAERDLADVAEEHVERGATTPKHTARALPHVRPRPGQRQDEHEHGDRDPQHATPDPGRGALGRNGRAVPGTVTASLGGPAAVTTAIRRSSRAGPAAARPALGQQDEEHDERRRRPGMS